MAHYDVHYSTMSLALEKVVENRQVIGGSEFRAAFRFRIEKRYLGFEIISV